ncbi:Transcription factor bHLH53 [Bienertia sinuspersici]
MALDWQNPNYFLNQFPPFEQQSFQFHDNSPLIKTEDFLCFDPLLPPLLDFENPLFIDLPFQELDFNHHDSDFSHPSFFNNIDSPPHMQDIFGYEEDDYSTQFIPLPKKQRIVSAPLPCFTPDFLAVSEFNPQTNPNYHHHYNEGGYYAGANYFNEGYGMNYYSNNVEDNKINKAVSTQSKAARERRRKITEKTQELGKLIPGGSKLNTAEMFQAAAKYVKFMQAQLGILQSINSLQQEGVKEAKLNNNLQMLTSKLVQEKLYAKEKCLVPLDFLPMLEENCDSKTNPSISQQIRNLLH